jgi:membrane protease YdiL (CAAX protease family)
MNSIRDYLKTKPLLIYFFLAFAISWGAIILSVGFDGFPLSEEQLPVLIAAMLLGPSGAALLAARLSSGQAGVRDLFSRLLRWRVKPIWYVVAILTAPLSTVAILAALSLFSPDFPSALAVSPDKFSLVLMWTVSGLMVGFFEELGWTGFATPRMRKRFGVFATGLIIGLLWGAWHLLVNLEGDTFAGALPLALLAVRLFTWLPAYRILMVWVYDHTESQLVVTIMHISLVATTGILDPVLGGQKLIVFLLAKAFIFWLFAAVAQLARNEKPAAVSAAA